jgi:TRAP-type C4-dicarboxylate transport system substrate-binding protein
MTMSSTGTSEAFWHYVQANSLDEFRGLKLLATHVHDGGHLHFTEKVVKSLEDLKGLKIRAPTRLGAKILSALGASPIQMPIPQVPEALSKSVIDGLSSPWEVMPTLKLEEIAHTHTETAPNQAKLVNSIFILGMNAAKFNSLPADLQAVIERNSGEVLSRRAGEVWDATIEPARKLAQVRGNTFTTLSDVEYKRWVDATEPVVQGWIKDVDVKGADGKKLLKSARDLLEKYNK